MTKKVDYKKKAMVLHEKLKGKIAVCSKSKVTKENLKLVYTPGVAEPCVRIAKNPKLAYDLTARGNLIAVISDGTAVLGLGDIGPLGAMPVMEGKCVLFKQFGGVDAFPLCLDTKDVDELVFIIKNLAPSFGGINLEDISAPRCFEIEKRLKKETDIPIFHDDQHGTAIVVLAGLINALKLAKKTAKNTKVVINGAGAAGIAIAEFLMEYGFKNMILVDKSGIISTKSSNSAKRAIARKTNLEKIKGNLKEALNNADIFIGVSAPNVLKADMIKAMKDNPIIFALSNPVPEIMPDVAHKCGVKIMATGRSDFPNQVNNVLAFPGIMQGALTVRASDINHDMKLAASIALANMVAKSKLSYTNIIPEASDLTIGPKVARFVAEAAIKTKVNRIKKDPKVVEKETRRLINEANKF
ncbi:NADP-dependent malic enzyme [bacterium]